MLGSDLVMSGLANETIDMQIQYKSIPKYMVPPYDIQATLRECIMGEINNTQSK